MKFYWLTIPLIILSYFFAPSALEYFEKVPVPENQRVVEQELLKMYGTKLKSVTISNKERLPANMNFLDSIYNHIPFEMPENGTIVGYEFATNAVSQVHHFNVYDDSYVHPFCEISQKAIYAVGEEMSPTYYEKGYGYVLNKGHKLTGEIMWLNESNKGIYARMNLKVFYVEGALTPITPTLIDVLSPCTKSEPMFEIPENSRLLLNSFNEGTELEVKKDYRISSLGGHCHEGCKHISLLVNGEPVEEFTPEYGDEHHPTAIHPKFTDLELKKGDKIGVEVYYESKHPQIDAMGMIMMILQ